MNTNAPMADYLRRAHDRHQAATEALRDELRTRLRDTLDPNVRQGYEDGDPRNGHVMIRDAAARRLLHDLDGLITELCEAERDVARGELLVGQAGPPGVPPGRVLTRLHTLDSIHGGGDNDG